MTSVIKNIRKYINSIDQDQTKHGHKWYNALTSFLVPILWVIGGGSRLPWLGSFKGTFKFILVALIGAFAIGGLLLLLLIGGSYLYFDILHLGN
jgi:hypothetical protein